MSDLSWYSVKTRQLQREKVIFELTGCTKRALLLTAGLIYAGRNRFFFVHDVAREAVRRFAERCGASGSCAERCASYRTGTVLAEKYKTRRFKLEFSRLAGNCLQPRQRYARISDDGLGRLCAVSDLSDGGPGPEFLSTAGCCRLFSFCGSGSR